MKCLCHGKLTMGKVIGLKKKVVSVLSKRSQTKLLSDKLRQTQPRRPSAKRKPGALCNVQQQEEVLVVSGSTNVYIHQNRYTPPLQALCHFSSFKEAAPHPRAPHPLGDVLKSGTLPGFEPRTSWFTGSGAAGAAIEGAAGAGTGGSQAGEAGNTGKEGGCACKAPQIGG
jgi:hypothetical protein